MDDKAEGKSPSMQVTRAMRRLRETVLESVEGAKEMPAAEGANSDESGGTSF